MLAFEVLSVQGKAKLSEDSRLLEGKCVNLGSRQGSVYI